ncbi:MAG: polysaccharide deacetylase family protein [Clostridia bacterium]|nr:polysaccharide deacetylase family protein [Clostridia bacterium]
MKKKSFFVSLTSISAIIATLIFCIYQNYNLKTVDVASEVIEDLAKISNKKIAWGIKRADNHEQPDVGKENKRIIDEYNGMCLGNSESKYVYLTFDAGYEAGYTEKILEVLKQNDVKATFFITGHYLNTQSGLVQKMIENGNTVGNHTVNYVMSNI